MAGRNVTVTSRPPPVAAHLRMAAALNPGWDSDPTARRITGLGLDPRMRARRLSGGHRAQRPR
ncbi:MAG: hypothetical protein ACRDOK_21715 [Streptosporangiaceae bacterium]